jgi:ribosomal protein S12 methylthiotransferase
MEDSLSAEEKEARKEEVMEVQQEVSFEKNRQKVGKTFKTLIDRKESTYFIGRTEGDSPEVDNEVIIHNKGLKIGQFYQVKITDAMEYDLVGQVL